MLHASELPGSQEEPDEIEADAVKSTMEQAAQDFGLDCPVILSTRLVAKAMVDNTRQALLINRNAKLTHTELNALIHHELGVHMATTKNALKQPLHVLKLGLPGNTFTQEGLAILAEYVSGNMKLSRLKQFALRVLTVDMMLKGMQFSSVFNCLKEEYKLSNNDAFALTTRVFRGGGFTKDYLYLGGFRDMVSLYNNRDIIPLFIGKTSSQLLDTVSELIERKIFLPPQFISKAITTPRSPSNKIMDYLVNSIK